LIHSKLPDIETSIDTIAFCELHGIGSAGMTRRAFVFIGER